MRRINTLTRINYDPINNDINKFEAGIIYNIFYKETKEVINKIYTKYASTYSYIILINLLIRLLNKPYLVLTFARPNLSGFASIPKERLKFKRIAFYRINSILTLLLYLKVITNYY